MHKCALRGTQAPSNDMHIDPEALLALAGLDPMPRRELTVNPCPEGYALTNVGGRLMCVLEGAQELSVEEALMRQMGASGPYGSHSSGRGRAGAPPSRGISHTQAHQGP